MIKDVRYGDAGKTFVVVTFSDDRTFNVSCDENNAVYKKVMTEYAGKKVKPFVAS